MNKEITEHQKLLSLWQRETSKPFTTREVNFAKSVINEVISEISKVVKHPDNTWMFEDESCKDGFIDEIEKLKMEK